MSFLGKKSVTKAGVPQIELESETKKINSNLDENESQVEENQIIPKHLFISDGNGYLKQWDIEQQKLMKDFGKIHSRGIYSLTATNDGRYLFTSDANGNLKQWGIEQQKLMKDFGKIHSGTIWSITATNNGRYLFTSDRNGELKQWDIEQQKLMKDFGKIHSGEIWSITATNDG